MLPLNITGGIDIITTQYAWAGVPVVTVQKTQKVGTNAQTSVVVTKFSYDDLLRVTKIEKKVSNSLVEGGGMSPNYKTIVENEYDKLGQLKKKLNCDCKCEKWEAVLEYLSKPGFNYPNMSKTEYRYRLNNYSESRAAGIGQPGQVGIERHLQPDPRNHHPGKPMKFHFDQQSDKKVLLLLGHSEL